jgi:hypothetical protein
MTNPPFGARVTGPVSLLKTFGLAGLGTRSDDVGYLTEVLFLERNLDWLKPSGRMLIVLPDSVLGNRTLAKARAFIEQRARLLAVISLDANTFGPSGAKTKTSIVILEKRDDEVDAPDEDDEVLLADVEHIGYDFTGRKTPESSQLPEVVKDFLAWELGDVGSSPSVTIAKRGSLGTTWLAQSAKGTATRANKSSSTRRERRDAGGSWTLGEIASEIGTGKTASRSEYIDEGIHMIKVGNLTGGGIQWASQERQYVSETWAEKHKKCQLQENDILFTASAHGPKWIGLKVDVFDGVPERFGPRAVFCAEIMRVRIAKGTELDPFYLLMFLRSPAGYAEIQRCIRGQSGHIYKEEVADIRVPKPTRAQAAVIQTAVDGMREALRLHNQTQKIHREAQDAAARVFPSKLKRPIVAK